MRKLRTGRTRTAQHSTAQLANQVLTGLKADALPQSNYGLLSVHSCTETETPQVSKASPQVCAHGVQQFHLLLLQRESLIWYNYQRCFMAEP